VVFLGPSLAPAEALRLLPTADFRPPIRRGDLQEFLTEPPAGIGIVDGEFFQSLAVSPKEILPLLERGIHVYGSSSIGALRATELARHGMRGVGKIFELFRTGRLIADDEVALTFNRETLRPLSEPLVNIRLALSAARQVGFVSLSELIALTRCMKAVYFPDRTLQRFFREATRLLGLERAAALRLWWSRAAPDTKAEDASLLLKTISRSL
jgi:TfuA protein